MEKNLILIYCVFEDDLAIFWQALRYCAKRGPISTERAHATGPEISNTAL